MFEKVNPDHPDKVADRIAGAMVDLAYQRAKTPKIAVEVLIGHGESLIISETSVHFELAEIEKIVRRIAGDNIKVRYLEKPQDINLAKKYIKEGTIRCGDNGIFLGLPLSEQEKRLSDFARKLYKKFPSDGKFIIERINSKQDNFYICQSRASNQELRAETEKLIRPTDHIDALNPLGEWTGGTEVDTGATNRKLGSDLGEAVTGGGLHGKDLRKADVAVTIYAHLLAQEKGERIEMHCVIGDEQVNGVPYTQIVARAQEYIEKLGSFEKLAEWGLV